ncbi:MAG TPA: hypothetical protein VIE13_13045 [Terriglobales bacterium]
MKGLRWVVATVAVAATLVLPAVEARAPMVKAQSWTIGQIGEAVVRPKQRKSLQDAIRRVREAERQIGASPGMKRAAWVGGAIPAALLVAGAAAVLSWVWLLLGWRRALAANAIVGVVACGYALIASWWLTREVQTAAAQVLQQAQQGPLGGFLHQLGVKPLPQWAGQFALAPQAGVWVLLLAFLALLAIPQTD